MISSITTPRTQAAPHSAFRSVRAILVVGGISALSAACSATASDGPRDVGNMAYPQPLLQGNLSTTSVAGRGLPDTGNMAYADPVPAGVIGRAAATPQVFDTGNMAYPGPLPAGSGPATIVK